ncbi:MAG: hypothetical protein OXG60_03485 [Chloroflexi bacterium]|nr:hypothetical protein [Chloroflexota bacterium]
MKRLIYFFTSHGRAARQHFPIPRSIYRCLPQKNASHLLLQRSKTKRRRPAPRLVGLFLAWLCLSSVVHAADIEVNDDCSLQDAIAAANNDIATGGCPAGDDADSIILAQDATITLLEDIAAITSDMTIEGNGATIDAAEQFRMFDIVEGASLTLNDVILQNARSGGLKGGATIFTVGGSVTINNSVIQFSYAPIGGAIAAGDAEIILNHSQIKASTAKHGGGAIWIIGETRAEIIDSTIGGDDAADANSTDWGGTIDFSDGALLVKNSVIANNSADSGGAIKNLKGTVEIIESDISHNAAVEGGAIYSLGGTLAIANSLIEDNQAVGYGGGIFSGRGTVTITDSSFSRNGSDESGGAIYSVKDTLTIANSDISENAVVRHGGGIFSAETTLNIADSLVHGNTANHGAGILVEKGSFEITASSITDNVAAENGGGLMLSNGTGNITDTSLTNNSALFGGAIGIREGTIQISASELSGNSAIRTGGALIAIRSTASITGSQILNNKANQAGGLASDGGTITIEGGATFSGNSAELAADFMTKNSEITISSDTLISEDGQHHVDPR